MTRWDDESLEVPECEQNSRRGGPQVEGSTDSDEAKRAALAAKKAEVRKRLEEAGKKGKKKKGFLTPERKKKLRKLLMIKAAENLKNQQKQLDSERQNVLSKRVPGCPDVDNINDKGQLEKIYNDLFQKMLQLEEEKYDINFQVAQKDAEINEMTINVNDLRGKFVKPTLKKVSKYDNKFRKVLAGEGGGGGDAKPKEDFRAKLKAVEKKNVMEVLESKQKSKAEKPEWSKKGEEKTNQRRASAASSSGTAPTQKGGAKPGQAEQPPQEEEEDEEVEEGEEEEEE